MSKRKTQTELYADLETGLKEAVRYQSNFDDQIKLALDTRRCQWPGQSDDGRKWSKNTKTEVFPCDGASDARVPLVDMYINQDVDVLMTALWAKRVSAVPVESGDARTANQAQNFLRWMLYQQTSELDAEAELLAQWILERGRAVMRVQWAREEELVYEAVTLAQVAAVCQKAARTDPQSGRARFLEYMADPANDQMLAEAVAPDLEVTPAVAKQMIRDLRADGKARWPKKHLAKDRPVLSALCPGVDVFWPADTTDLNTARAIFVVEYLSAETLRTRAASLEWDDKWLEYILEHGKGQRALNLRPYADTFTKARALETKGEELFQIVTAYSRRSDAIGVAGVWVTVFCPASFTDGSGGYLVAKDELLDYWHGKLPFVLFQRERLSRLPDDSRSYGEVASTWQSQIKTEWDGRIDRASMSTLPPKFHPPGRKPQRWGPGVNIPYITRNEVYYADIPHYDIGSKEVEDSVRRMADGYFGRKVEGVDPMYSEARLRRMVGRWLLGWSEVANQMFSLQAQYGPPEIRFRVTGDPTLRTLTRAEIQGRWDVAIGFNTMTLDPEQTKQVLGMLMEMTTRIDTNGEVSRNELLRVAFDVVDPNLGDRLLKQVEDARQTELDDEDNVFVKLLAGLEQDVRPGQAHGARLQRLRENFQSSPEAQKKVLDESNPRVKAVFEKRVKQLEFQLQQLKNAQIGKLGA